LDKIIIMAEEEQKFDLQRSFAEALLGEKLPVETSNSQSENSEDDLEDENQGNQSDNDHDEEEEENENSDDNDSDDDSEDDENDEDEQEDIFGVLKSTKKKPQIKLDFEPQKEIISLISKKYGVKDLPTFLTSADTWREQAQEGVKIKNQYEAILSDLQSMPPDLARSVNLWANGEDWTKVNDQRLDYSKPFEKQDVNGLVQQYFPEEYAEEEEKLKNEEISKAEFERSVKLLSSSSKKLFQKDKDSLELQRVQFENNQKEIAKKVKTSALDSVKTLSKTYPHFSSSELKKIENILMNGEADDLLYEANGTYKPNVAESVAYVLYGAKMMERIKKQAENRGESKAREEVVNTSDKKLKTSKQNSSKDTVDLSSIKHLQGINKPSPFQNRIVSK